MQFRLRFIDTSTLNIIRDERWKFAPKVGEVVLFDNIEWPFKIEKLYQDLLQNKTVVYVTPLKGVVDHPETQTKEVAEVNPVVSMAARANDATLQTPEQVLKEALTCIGKKGALKSGKKLLILALDDTTENYDVSFMQAGMRMSECLTLTEVGKALFLTEMGYLE
jgi:hypothetical protein